MTVAASVLPQHPVDGEGVTPGYLNALLADAGHAFRVSACRLVGAKTYGQEMVSTAGRALVEVEYAPGAPADLPSRLVVKLARGVDDIMGPFYSNEVAFYARLRPELDIEAPRTLGAHYDTQTHRLGLILEDLTARQATFPNVLTTVSLAQVRGLLDTLALLHARFWNSPRFAGDLAWLETHLDGDVANLMNNLAPAYIQHEIDTQKFKTELVGKLGTTGAELLAGVQAMQRHQASLSQTVLHGDTHLGNTYLLPGDKGGLLDWQLSVRGHHMHDINYLITTALPIAERRAHEKDLLAYYLDRLAAAGVTDLPPFEATFREYRRTLVWGVYVGWLTTPVVNYGWEINVVNHLRLVTAYEDHDTAALVAELI
nr:G15 [uncultured bacterium]